MSKELTAAIQFIFDRIDTASVEELAALIRAYVPEIMEVTS